MGKKSSYQLEDFKGALIGVVAGGFIGACAALLLSSRSEQLKKNLSGTYCKACQQAQDIVESAMEKKDEVLESLGEYTEGIKTIANRFMENLPSSQTTLIISAIATAAIGSLALFFLSPKSKDLTSSTTYQIKTMGKSTYDSLKSCSWLTVAAEILDSLSAKMNGSSPHHHREKRLEKDEETNPEQRAHEVLDVAISSLKLWKNLRHG